MALHFEGLRKKIIKNYFTIIIITITFFEGIFIAYIQNYYYDSVKKTVQHQVEYTDLSYNTIAMENESFERKINNAFVKETLDKNSKFLVQFIDKQGYVVLDQYGFKTNENLTYYEDVQKALNGTNNLKPYTYKIGLYNEKTHEYKKDSHVMSISVPIKVNGIIEGAIRYTISLDRIDNTIFKLSLALILAGIFILIISLSLSLKFAETLIQPIRDLKQFANELADGNYSIKLKNTNIPDDEIGDLGQTFEHMASEIDKSRKLKEEFISSISHELRTPLTSIKGWSETLGYEGISKDEVDLGLGIIQDETDRLITLVEELLDFSRLSSDRIKLQVDLVDLEVLVRGVVNQLRIKGSEKNITITSLFNTEGMSQIQGDKNRLRQVLINLIQNSIKFSQENGFINVVVTQENDYTMIKVSDNGCGIEKENLEKVLDKFFQEDYNKSGSGLGLAISNEIIKLHGGKMNIESEKDIGTAITFTLKNKLLESI